MRVLHPLKLAALYICTLALAALVMGRALVSKSVHVLHVTVDIWLDNTHSTFFYSYSKMNINIDLNILKYELFLDYG